MSETKITIKKPKYNDLKNYLNTKKNEKGQESSHTSIYINKTGLGYSGSFFIPNDTLDDFFNIYYKSVFENKEDSFLVERHENIGPIIYDIDLRYNVNQNLDRIYTKDTIYSLLKNIMVEIEKYLLITTDIERYAFVLEKNKPSLYSDEIMKDGFHIVFPYLVTCPDLQYMIRDNLLETCKGIFSNSSVINSIDDIIDKSIIKANGWQLYGSRKPGSEPYKLTEILKINTSEVEIIKNTYSDYQLVRLLSIRGRQQESNKIKDFDLKLDEYNSKNKSKSNNKTVNSNRSINTSRKRKGKKNTTNENIHIIKELVDILDIKRSESYKTWIEVGWCLHNIDYNLLETWIKFSKKSSNKYHQDNCEKDCNDLWEYMNDEGLNLGSLHFWCQKDNKEKYTEIVNRHVQSVILRNLTGNSVDTAKVVYCMFKHKYVCTSIQHKTWYEFRNHKWVELDGGITLRQDISNAVRDQFSKMSSTLNDNSIVSGGDNPDKEIFINRSKKVQEINIKIGTTSFKEQLMKESAELFYDPQFYEKLDSYNDLLGFENGVYDLKNMEFREGRPEDYISLTTGINYQEYDNSDPIVQEIFTFFSQVLPNQDVRRYVLTLLATCLSGSTANEKFHIWTGSGGNGKSKVIELFESALGTYCCKLPITVLTQKRPASNSAAPEMLRTKGRRFVCLQEPDDNEKIMVGCMKELTGGDKIQARGLYKEPVEFKPQFKMLLTCNHLPSVPSDDGGTWRRIRLVEFLSKFVENPSLENEYPIDSELAEKMKDWSEAFANILIKYYKIYKFGDPDNNIEAGLHEPKEVMVCTEKYRKVNDTYSEFITDNIEENNKGILKLEEAYALFKIWYKESYSNNKVPPKKELKSYMEKKYGMYPGKGKKSGWIGIRLINHNIDDEEDLLTIHDNL